MSSIRLAACAALATAALVVPATASAKDEAATAAAIGTQPAASTAPATLSAQLVLLQQQRLNALPQAVAKLAQETSTLTQQIKDASARGDVLAAQKLTEQSQLNMLSAQSLMSKQNAALEQIRNVSAGLAEAMRATEAAAKAAAAGAQPAGASSMGKDEAATAAAIGTQPPASTAPATVPALFLAVQAQRENALQQKLAALAQETSTLNQQIKDANARGDMLTAQKLTEQSQLNMIDLQRLAQQSNQQVELLANTVHKFQMTTDMLLRNMP